MDYILHILIMGLLYVMLAQSLTILIGYPRMISLAHAGFYGIGAYATAILSVEYGTPFLFNMLLAVFISGAIAILISLIALRSVDDYFIIITIGIQVMIYSMMQNWDSMTNGPLGIIGIPEISFMGFHITSKMAFFLLTLSITIATYLLIRRIIKSPFGMVLRGISEDEIFIQSQGRNVVLLKSTSFVLSAMLAAIPGVLYAHYISFIDPTSFTINESLFVLSIVIIGGINNLKRVALAAFLLVLIPELLRVIGLSVSAIANLRQIIYGVLLVIIIIFNRKYFND